MKPKVKLLKIIFFFGCAAEPQQLQVGGRCDPITFFSFSQQGSRSLSKVYLASKCLVMKLNIPSITPILAEINF